GRGRGRLHRRRGAGAAGSAIGGAACGVSCGFVSVDGSRASPTVAAQYAELIVQFIYNIGMGRERLAPHTLGPRTGRPSTLPISADDPQLPRRVQFRRPALPADRHPRGLGRRRLGTPLGADDETELPVQVPQIRPGAVTLALQRLDLL